MHPRNGTARFSSGSRVDSLREVEYLSLADFLLIAEVATGTPAETLRRLPSLALAESALAAPAASFLGVDFYPDFIDKAAVLCTRIVRNHALPPGGLTAVPSHHTAVRPCDHNI